MNQQDTGWNPDVPILPTMNTFCNWLPPLLVPCGFLMLFLALVQAGASLGFFAGPILLGIAGILHRLNQHARTHKVAPIPESQR